MPVMLSKTFDALAAAGAPEEKAREAADELAAYENRFAKIETDFAVIKMDAGRQSRGLAVDRDQGFHLTRGGRLQGPDRLAVGAGRSSQVGTPKHPARAERIEDAAQMRAAAYAPSTV
jgi:hypothetical protein